MTKFKKDTLNPHKLYKNPDQGWIAGVCAGVAVYYDFNATGVRLITFFLIMFSFPFALMLYVILAFTLKKRPVVIFEDEESEEFWRSMKFTPRDLSKELKYKFLRIEDKLKKIENYVTSSEFELENKYKELDKLK